MIIHYNFKCSNCGQEHLDLTEGTMCFGDDSIYEIYKCKKIISQLFYCLGIFFYTNLHFSWANIHIVAIILLTLWKLLK